MAASLDTRSDDFISFMAVILTHHDLTVEVLFKVVWKLEKPSKQSDDVLKVFDQSLRGWTALFWIMINCLLIMFT